MRQSETQQERYERCNKEGCFILLIEPDASQIRTMFSIASGDLQAAKDWVKQSP